MKIEFLKSACYLLTGKNKNVLVDPWLVDGEYYGSWYHYPQFNLSKFIKRKIDYIYISHIHPDHFSKLTLKKLNKNIKIIILKYAKPFLRFNIESLGFKNIIELDHEKKLYIENDFFIETYAADDCDPKICQNFFKCHFFQSKVGTNQIDSLSVFSINGKKILNVNDCPIELTERVVNKIKKKHKTIDLLLTGYAGAGPFPQCFSYSKNKLKQYMIKKQEKFINQATKYIEISKPKYVIPFAGTYYLGSKMYSLNKYRGVPTRFEGKNLIIKKIKSKKIKTKIFLLKTFGAFDLNDYKINDELKSEEVFFDKKMKNYLSKKKLDYQLENIPNYRYLIGLLHNASNSLFKKIKNMNLFSKTLVAIKLNSKKYFVINLYNNQYNIFNFSEFSRKKYVILDLDKRLLVKILRGPKFAHWDNADIGSHIKYERKPDSYDRALNYAINFLHC